MAAIDPNVVVITGMSGAGRTEAMHTFEDLGYYVIDSLPPMLIPQIVNMLGISNANERRLAVVCDLRTQSFFEDLMPALDELDRQECSYAIVYLDATDEAIRRRYALNRRPHPLARAGESTSDAVKREREFLAEARHRATVVIDTSDLTPKELRTKLRDGFSELTDAQLMKVRVFSFGFKYGMPDEADLIIDVRFLPNPYWDPALRNLTGNDEPVRDFVLEHEQTKRFLEAWKALLDAVMPGYVAEGKSQLSIGVGCTGGQHRSVALANYTASYLESCGYQVNVAHRELDRRA
jgi:UPF0042 nucleotide-binding protein